MKARNITKAILFLDGGAEHFSLIATKMRDAGPLARLPRPLAMSEGAREERAAAKAAGVDYDSEQYSSAGGPAGQSEKSGSKKTKGSGAVN